MTLYILRKYPPSELILINNNYKLNLKFATQTAVALSNIVSE